MPRRKMLVGKGTQILILFAGILLNGSVMAQSSGGEYALLSSTIDTGGAILTGGEYELAGTVGQPDAFIMTAGEFTLSGGFLQDVMTFPLPVSLSAFSVE